ncbi:MAG: type III pantothenate kinase [Eggerthellaceae bacterium]|nr:type III pantothenate kinase [Eggerthellaceae bacterium]
MAQRLGEEASDNLVLAVDAGNTRIVMGAFDGTELLASWSITAPASLTDDEAYAAVSSALGFMAQSVGRVSLDVTGSILASVVPHLSQPLSSALRCVTDRRPLTVGPGLKTGIKMKYRDPAELGADRIADIAGALDRYEPPFIVIDLGTTTNFEVVDADGAFIGGIIAPGMALGAQSLSEHAAKLPAVDIAAPRDVVGSCTREAIQSGVVLGEVARIDGLVSMIRQGHPADFRVIATGSNASSLVPLLQCGASRDPDLTLHGLAVLYSLNRKARS